MDVELVVVVSAPSARSAVVLVSDPVSELVPEAPLRALEDELSVVSVPDAEPAPVAPLRALEDELPEDEADPDAEAPLNALEDDPLSALADEEEEIFDWFSFPEPPEAPPSAAAVS